MARKLLPAQKPLPNRTQYEADMDNFVPPVRPKTLLKLLGQVVVGIVVLAVVVVGVVWLISHLGHSSSPHKTTPAIIQNKPLTSIDATTKHYDSSNFNLGLDYPADWTVSDTATKLSVVSPALQLKSQDGQAFTGQIVLNIQNQQTTVSQFAAGTAVAVLESQKLTYKSPTPDQRAQTYLTFASYSGTTSIISALYITGDDGYQAGQSIPMSDIVQDDPLVSISFLKCSTTTCSATTATTIPASDWQDNNLSQPLVKLLESLVLS